MSRRVLTDQFIIGRSALMSKKGWWSTLSLEQGMFVPSLRPSLGLIEQTGNVYTTGLTTSLFPLQQLPLVDTTSTYALSNI